MWDAMIVTQTHPFEILIYKNKSRFVCDWDSFAAAPLQKSIEQKQNCGVELVKFYVNLVKWVMDVFSFPCPEAWCIV